MGLILHAVLWRFGLRQTMASVRQAHPNLLILGITLMMVAYLIRGARWRIWDRCLSYWDSLRLILIGFMGNNILPARLGEIPHAHCAAAKTENDCGRTTALASIAAERTLTSEGIIAVDDFFNVGWADVSFATYDFLRRTDTIVPFAVTSKLYLAAPTMADKYKAALSRRADLGQISCVQILGREVLALRQGTLKRGYDLLRGLIARRTS